MSDQIAANIELMRSEIESVKRRIDVLEEERSAEKKRSAAIGRAISDLKDYLTSLERKLGGKS